MASGLTKFGNDLYTGQRNVPFVPLRRIWLTIAAVLMLAAIAVPFVRGAGDFAAGFNFGIEFRGGSQFQVADASSIDSDLAVEAVHSVVPDAAVRVTTVGADGLRVQTDQLENDALTQEVTEALKVAYDTDTVDDSFIGASWGADITRQALIGLGVFLGLAAILMAIYFRTWKMSAAAMVALAHDLVITVGVYGAVGFEITNAGRERVRGTLSALGAGE